MTTKRAAEVQVAEAAEEVEHCWECGHPWELDEPAHYPDCRYCSVEVFDEDGDDAAELSGWKTYRPVLL